jgi:hypothetical protein
MKKRILTAVILCGALLAGGLVFPAPGAAGVRIGIGIGISLPPLVIPAPPALVVIPGTYAYYPPSVGVDVFFYHGYWYRPYQGYWYMADDYNGPWSHIVVERVPPVLLGLPPAYRHISPGYGPMPYSRVQKHWRTWERDRYWDRHEGKGEHRGHERGRGWND